MFLRKNYTDLERSINNLNESDQGKERYGSQLAVGWLIKRVVYVLEGHYCINEQDNKVLELENFRKILRLRWPALFSGAPFRSFTRRNEDLRLPDNLPSEEDVEKLLNYIEESLLSEIKSLDGDLCQKSQYQRLRNLIVSSLTLENARRGEEASRLLIGQWEDAKAGKWMK